MRKILHTVTCTVYQPAFNAHEQFTRHLTRPYPLTLRGIERLFKHGCPEYPAMPEVRVIRVQKAHYSPR
jgi:hypothetical protein